MTGRNRVGRMIYAWLDERLLPRPDDPGLTAGLRTCIVGRCVYDYNPVVCDGKCGDCPMPESYPSAEVKAVEGVGKQKGGA